MALTETLVEFIKSHGHAARIENGKIIATERFSDKSEREVALEPALNVVRDWLGY